MTAIFSGSATLAEAELCLSSALLKNQFCNNDCLYVYLELGQRVVSQSSILWAAIKGPSFFSRFF